ncbi:MAG: PAS domain-containing protein [Acidobacteria bacterium]|nr:PAS domain-containing protein [Acidobacteriota bacterium]MBI3422280.1 PAS domain-containing protein [Acidobacteriota bacterium]
MTQERRQTILATLVVIIFFGAYELAKTLLFPAMDVNTSHVISTIVVGVLTFIVARFVIHKQYELLKERGHANQQLRDALAQAEHSSNLLRSIVASVAEGLVITDRDANVLLVNDAARTLLNLGTRSLARLTDLSRDPQVHRAFTHVLAKGERAEARLETREAETQNRRILRLYATPLHLRAGQSDGPDGVVGAFIDITQLERLEIVRQEFLANVSHELRTPLAAITAYTETLLDGGLDDAENSLRFLHTIQRNAERMRALVNDIAELTAIESGQVRLTLESVPLRLFVNEIFSHLKPRAAEQQVALQNETLDDLRVTADPRRLEQILINLIDNAIKFNRSEGSVTVTTSLSECGNHHLIHVRDTGSGIPAEHLPRVFERFYRVDKARSRAIGGTGLGLAIVKHLALAHGGEASVTSEVGQGCEFTIKLPVRAFSAVANQEAKNEPAEIVTAA